MTVEIQGQAQESIPQKEWEEERKVIQRNLPYRIRHIVATCGQVMTFCLELLMINGFS